MDEEEPIFSVSSTWTKPPTRLAALGGHCCNLAQLVLCCANLRLLAYTPSLLAVLMGCLYEVHDGGDEGLYGGAANGASTYEYRVTFRGLNRPRIWPERPRKTLDDKPSDAIHWWPMPCKRWSTSLFPALTHVFTNPCCPRAVMIGALDVLMEFINQALSVGIAGSVYWEEEEDDDALPSLRALLVSIHAVLERLLDLLYIPRQGPDSMDYLDPVHHLVSRTDKLKYVVHYNTAVDAELRD